MENIRFDNSFRLAGGFYVTNAEPIDSRAYVNDINHIYLDSNWVNVKPYPGLIVSDPTGEVRICINSNYSEESSWLVVRTNTPSDDNGDGINTVVANNYTEALNRFAKESNIGLFVYIISDETINDVIYNAGPYVVSGDNTLIKININDYSNIITGATYKDTTIVSNNTIILDNFITTNDLGNYTYNKEEIDNKLKEIDLFSVVTELPSEENINPNKIYLINNNGEEGNTFTEYIYVDGNWEIIGNLTVETDFTEYYTKTEIDSKLNTTNITLSENIEESDYAAGDSVQSVLSDIHNRIKSINNGGAVNITPGSGITIDNNSIGVKISTNENNALGYDKDGALYVKNLEARLVELEELLSKVITTDNIGDYAVTSIEYGDTTNDISINKGENGKYTLTLDSITNIAYNDATEIKY